MRHMGQIMLRAFPLLLMIPILAGCLGQSSVEGQTGIDYLLTATVAPTATTQTFVPSNIITMDTGSFSGNQAIQVKAGTPVTFQFDAPNGLHILVTGTSGRYVPAPGAPDVLNSATGVSIKGGAKQNIVFANPGTYSITCTLHPAMEAVINVTP